ncbi:hypothetical protein D3C72_2078470 [compost metagenome]
MHKKRRPVSRDYHEANIEIAQEREHIPKLLLVAGKLSDSLSLGFAGPFDLKNHERLRLRVETKDIWAQHLPCSQ